MFPGAFMCLWAGGKGVHLPEGGPVSLEVAKQIDSLISATPLLSPHREPGLLPNPHISYLQRLWSDSQHKGSVLLGKIALWGAGGNEGLGLLNLLPAEGLGLGGWCHYFPLCPRSASVPPGAELEQYHPHGGQEGGPGP